MCWVSYLISRQKNDSDLSPPSLSWSDSLNAKYAIRFCWSLLLIISADHGFVTNLWAELKVAFNRGLIVVTPSNRISRSRTRAKKLADDATFVSACSYSGFDRNYGSDSDSDAASEFRHRSILNSRSWVMQEEVLMRRILHFKRRQACWQWLECTNSEDGLLNKDKAWLTDIACRWGLDLRSRNTAWVSGGDRLLLIARGVWYGKWLAYRECKAHDVLRLFTLYIRGALCTAMSQNPKMRRLEKWSQGWRMPRLCARFYTSGLQLLRGGALN
jgi:hypothetical protein